MGSKTPIGISKLIYRKYPYAALNIFSENSHKVVDNFSKLKLFNLDFIKI